MTPRPRLRLPIEDRHLSVLLERRARQQSDRPFLSIEGNSYTYGAAYERVLQVAAGLADAGLAEGDRIGVLLPNCEAFVWTWFAAAHLGATIVVMNPQLRGMTLDHALADSDCSLLVAHANDLAAVEPIIPMLRKAMKCLALVGGAAPSHGDFVPFDQLFGDAARAPARRGDYRTTQSISFTSGSTGPSKGVLLSNNQSLDIACTFIHAMGLTEIDVIFSPFPLFHGMSNRLAVLPALVMGAQVVISDRFSASKFWQQVTEAKATVAQTLHSVTAMLKAQPPSPWDRAHHVTRMYNTRYDEEFEQRFGVHLIEAFGMTEIGVTTYSPYPERRPGSAGRVHPDWEVAILDEEDRPLPRGQQGELAFRPREPYLMTVGYAKRPDAMVEATRNLWFHTGDIGRQDEDGYVYFLDRKKERIRRRGENISSFEVELSVIAHPDIRECAVLPYPAEQGEDEVRLVVVKAPESSLTAPALYEWLQRAMPRYMLPRYIEFVESLPRTPNNKIEKFKLLTEGLASTVWDREKQSKVPAQSAAPARARADVVFDAKSKLAEGPVWDATAGALYWVDIPDKKLYRGDPATGRFVHRDLPWKAARVTPSDDGRLLISFTRSFALGRFEDDPFEDIRFQGDVVGADERFNDGSCDALGRFWTGSYDKNLAPSSGHIYCLDRGNLVVKASGIRLSNGLRFSPDGQTLYFVDTLPGRIWAYPCDSAGVLGKPRLLVDYEGRGFRPDGCAMDTDGCLWVAEVDRGCVSRYTPDGGLDSSVEVPVSKPTSVCFGGSDHRTLFITSRSGGLTPGGDESKAGCVFAARVGIGGFPEYHYAVGNP